MNFEADFYNSSVNVDIRNLYCGFSDVSFMNSRVATGAWKCRTRKMSDQIAELKMHRCMQMI